MNTAYAVVIWLLLLAWPAAAVIIDGVAGIRAHGLTYKFAGETQEDFRILVPVWGSVRYLINARELSRYGSRVTLVTSGDETPEFYRELHQVALTYDFEIWHDTPTAARGGPGQKHRSTSRPVRDRLIRNVLPTVAEPYVIPLDADSFPSRPLGELAGELVRRDLDIASVRIMPGNPRESVLTRLQFFEYWLAMQIRFIAPWLVSGACQVARTPVLRDVMSRHSLFFQGNDVEIGLLSEARGYRIGHIAFEIKSDVPAKFVPWVRQRMAWAGGQFRLFFVNIRFSRRHPFLWIYGAGAALIGLAFRWQIFVTPPRPLLWAAAGGYASLVVYLYLRRGGGNGWVLAMPFYVLFSSFFILPLGPIWYVKMSWEHHNWGVIRPGFRVSKPPRVKPVRYGFRRAPRTKVMSTLTTLLAVVVLIGAIVTGGFTRLPELPSGIVSGAAAQVRGTNVIKTPVKWSDEQSTAVLPTYRVAPGDSQEILYDGRAGDAAPLASGSRKIEVFQADVGYPFEQQGVRAGVKPGQQWRFQVTIKGLTFKSYVMVGMEWFKVETPKVIYLGESDVYPKISALPEQVTVTCPPLPKDVKALAIYIQLPEINPGTHIDVQVSDPYLVRVKLPDHLAVALQGHRRLVARLEEHGPAADVDLEAALCPGRRAHLGAADERAAGSARDPEGVCRILHGQARDQAVAGPAVHLETGAQPGLGAAAGQRDPVAPGDLVAGQVGVRGAARQRHVVAVDQVNAPGLVAVAVAVPQRGRGRRGGPVGAVQVDPATAVAGAVHAVQGRGDQRGQGHAGAAEVAGDHVGHRQADDDVALAAARDARRGAGPGAQELDAADLGPHDRAAACDGDRRNARRHLAHDHLAGRAVRGQRLEAVQRDGCVDPVGAGRQRRGAGAVQGLADSREVHDPALVVRRCDHEHSSDSLLLRFIDIVCIEPLHQRSHYGPGGGREKHPMTWTKNHTIAAVALGGVLVLGSAGTAAYAMESNHSAPVATATATPTVKPVPTKTVTAPPRPVPVKTVTKAPKPARTVYVQPVAAAQPAFTNSLAVVAQYYQDITNQDYQAAWNLGGDNLNGGVGYSAWVAGYSTTASIDLTGQADWNSGAVLTDISALQSDGSVRTYSGTYYVSGGVITSASIVQTDGYSYAPAAAAPSSLTFCGADLYAGPSTSCAFALSVAQAANAAGDPYSVTAYSPVTGLYYTMTQTSTSPLTYEGGNDALVQFGS